MPKPCVFCGEFAPMTKEHIWGEWIRQYVPLGANKHSLRDVEVNKAGQEEHVSITQRNGSALGSYRKIVCDHCNNDFLSRIQNRAKPFLVPLLEGRKTALGVNAQTAIATWATMVSMTAEFFLTSSGKIAISWEDRTRLRETETALPDWNIWIGYYASGANEHRWTHTSIPIVGGAELPGPDNNYSPLPNTQTTTFVVGKLYVHTMRSHYPEVSRNWHWLGNPRLRHLHVPIWPIRHELIAWPIHGLSDADVTLASEMFIRWLGDIAWKAGF